MHGIPKSKIDLPRSLKASWLLCRATHAQHQRYPLIMGEKHLWHRFEKKMTKYTLYTLARRFRIRISENITLVCINTDNLGFGLQIFWAVDCVWRVLPTNMRRDEPQSSGLCCWGFLRADRGGEANTMGEDVSHSKLEKLLVAFWECKEKNLTFIHRAMLVGLRKYAGRFE